MDGIVNVMKPAGMTSHDVVAKLRRVYHTKKVGHTGTLDPMATGVLVVCINKATKIAELLTSLDKEYIAEFTLGLFTDTLDSTGTILKEEKAIIEKEDIQNAFTRSGFHAGTKRRNQTGIEQHYPRASGNYAIYQRKIRCGDCRTTN